jgi:hypothetical protein
MDFKNLTYIVENQPGVTYEQALRIWKTMYKDFDEFLTKVIIYDGMQEFADHCASVWKEIELVKSVEAFSEKNLEIRRLYFKAIGIEKMFKELEPMLVDRQVIQFSNTTYDEKNNPNIEMINDIYELYCIEGKKMFPEETSSWRQSNADVYAVRCWCTTTKREYWIYVPRFVGEKKDALEAIAWTFMLNITEPEYIVRQGDIIIAKASDNSREIQPYHLDKATYLKFLRTQS